MIYGTYSDWTLEGTHSATMHRPAVKIIALIVVVAIVSAGMGFWYAVHIERSDEKRSLAYTQALLAFGHYKFYERIESLLAQTCYPAALTEARELKHLQLWLVSDNLQVSGNDHELLEYIRIRDPKVLETISAGRVSEPKPYTTTCP